MSDTTSSTGTTLSTGTNTHWWPRTLTLIIGIELALIGWRLVPGLPQTALLPLGEKLAWYLTRSSGTTAYVLLTLSTVWGLLLSTKLVKEWVPAPLAMLMHNWLAWIAVGLSAFHAIVLLFDSYYTYTIGNLLLPFTGPYRPLWVGVGTLSFYLSLLTSASFYTRRWMGPKAWRRIHYLTFLTFGMVTLHGWAAGTDNGPLRWLFLGSGSLVLFLTVYRILDAMQSGREPKVKRQRADGQLPNVAQLAQ